MVYIILKCVENDGINSTIGFHLERPEIQPHKNVKYGIMNDASVIIQETIRFKIQVFFLDVLKPMLYYEYSIKTRLHL